MDCGTTEPGPVFTASAVQLTIYGVCYSLKNSKTLSTRKGKPRIIKHWKARHFQDDFCLQVPPEYRQLRMGCREKPLRSSITVFYPSWRQDLDCSVIYDCLQLAGVVSNDRYIVEKHEFRAMDRNRPRAEIVIEEL
jgi:Holliday junction resolvase RusA-like endonuclease